MKNKLGHSGFDIKCVDGGNHINAKFTLSDYDGKSITGSSIKSWIKKEFIIDDWNFYNVSREKNNRRGGYDYTVILNKKAVNESVSDEIRKKYWKYSKKYKMIKLYNPQMLLSLSSVDSFELGSDKDFDKLVKDYQDLVDEINKSLEELKSFSKELKGAWAVNEKKYSGKEDFLDFIKNIPYDDFDGYPSDLKFKNTKNNLYQKVGKDEWFLCQEVEDKNGGSEYKILKKGLHNKDIADIFYGKDFKIYDYSSSRTKIYSFNVNESRIDDVLEDTLENTKKIDEDKWITIRGRHTLVDDDGNIKDDNFRKKVEAKSEKESRSLSDSLGLAKSQRLYHVYGRYGDESKKIIKAVKDYVESNCEGNSQRFMDYLKKYIDNAGNAGRTLEDIERKLENSKWVIKKGSLPKPSNALMFSSEEEPLSDFSESSFNEIKDYINRFYEGDIEGFMDRVVPNECETLGDLNKAANRFLKQKYT